MPQTDQADLFVDLTEQDRTFLAAHGLSPGEFDNDVADDWTGPDPANPFVTAAQHLFDGDWWIFKVPYRRKNPPAVGYTGRARTRITQAELDVWLHARHPLGNIASALPPGIIALDVDDYGDKHGARELAELEALHGKLPPTVRIECDGPHSKSGKLLYRAPPDLIFHGCASPAIDICQPHHRFIMLPPSVSPRTGEPYRTYWPDGRVDHRMPPVADPVIPALPATFVEALRKPEKQDRRHLDDLADVAPLEPEQAQAWQAEKFVASGGCAHVLRAAQEWIDTLGVDSGRHDHLLGPLLAFLRLVAGGHRCSARVMEAMRSAFVAVVGPDRAGGVHEAYREFVSAWEGGIALVAAGSGTDSDCETVASPITEGALVARFDANAADFWSARPELTAIRNWARHRMVSPSAVLGDVLVRVLHSVPCWVRLPAVISGPGQLNLIAVIAGPPQSGKDGAVACAADAVRIPPTRDLQAVNDPWPYQVLMGSGEGIAHQYAEYRQVIDEADPDRKRKVMQQVRTRWATIFRVPEVGTLTATAKREGSTLVDHLCNAWTGGAIGQANATQDRRLSIPAHDYRLGTTIGAQPRRCGALFDHEDAGLPHRFVWFDAVDAEVGEEVPEFDDPPEPFAMVDPLWHTVPIRNRPLTVAYPPEVTREVRASRHRVNRGKGTVRDGHTMFSRCKVMVALCVLNGRRVPDLEDWRLAGQVIDGSLAVEEQVREELAASAAKEAIARDERAALTAVRVERAKDEDAQDRAERSDVTREQVMRERILDRFANGQEWTRADLARAGSRPSRGLFRVVFDGLCAAGELVPSDADGKAKTWRRA